MKFVYGMFYLDEDSIVVEGIANFLGTWLAMLIGRKSRPMIPAGLNTYKIRI